MNGRDGHHLSTGSLRRQYNIRKKKRKQRRKNAAKIYRFIR